MRREDFSATAAVAEILHPRHTTISRLLRELKGIGFEIGRASTSKGDLPLKSFASAAEDEAHAEWKW